MLAVCHARTNVSTRYFLRGTTFLLALPSRVALDDPVVIRVPRTALVATVGPSFLLAIFTPYPTPTTPRLETAAPPEFAFTL